MDCSKTIDFLSELKRLCDTRDECVANAANKEDCPMFGICKLTHSKTCAKDAEKAIEIVQKWSDEHPRRKHTHRTFLRSFRTPSRVQRVCRGYAARIATAEAVSTPQFPERVRHRVKTAGMKKWRRRTMNKKKARIMMCTHFNCDHRRGNYCCFQCQKIGTCKNPCYNSPLKCGLAKDVERHENPDA